MAKLLTFTGNFRNSSAFHHRSSDYHMQVALWTLRYATHMDILIQKNLPAATLPFFFFLIWIYTVMIIAVIEQYSPMM